MGLPLGFCAFLFSTLAVTSSLRPASAPERHSLTGAGPHGLETPLHQLANVVDRLRLRGQLGSSSLKTAAVLGEQKWQVVLWAIVVPMAILVSVLLFIFFHLLQDPDKQPLSEIEEAAPELIAGTPCRMARLPPTARAGTPKEATTEASPGLQQRLPGLPPTASPGLAGPSPAQRPKNGNGNSDHHSTVGASTMALMSSQGSAGSQERSLPPPLSPKSSDYASGSQVPCDSTISQSGCFTWTVPHQACRDLCSGCDKCIVVGGSPPFHAKLGSNGTQNETWLEVSRIPGGAPEAIIGPLNEKAPLDAAKIIGPDGQEYGSFVRNGKGFAVSHSSRAGQVLTLDPVETRKGSFLEISAPDGDPIGLAKLNPPDGPGVEIDADPEVDAALIISCVLASFVSEPGLISESCPSNEASSSDSSKLNVQ